MVKHVLQHLHDGDVDITKGFRGFALGGEHTTWSKDPTALLEKSSVEQAFGRASRI